MSKIKKKIMLNINKLYYEKLFFYELLKNKGFKKIINFNKRYMYILTLFYLYID